MPAKIYGGSLYAVDAFRITVEASVTKGIRYIIAGLPDDAIKESHSRIAIAIGSSGYYMPRTKLVIYLSPAHAGKTGTAFDLPIALGILMASEQVTDFRKLEDHWIAGEVGLDGSIYQVRGALCMAFQAKNDDFKGIVFPGANASRPGKKNRGIWCKTFKRSDQLYSGRLCTGTGSSEKIHLFRIGNKLDFKDVKGQQDVKRAMEIAAASSHNLLLMGPRGIGETLIAKRLPSILPPMTLEESLETSGIYSVLKNPEPHRIEQKGKRLFKFSCK